MGPSKLSFSRARPHLPKRPKLSKLQYGPLILHLRSTHINMQPAGRRSSNPARGTFCESAWPWHAEANVVAVGFNSGICVLMIRSSFPLVCLALGPSLSLRCGVAVDVVRGSPVEFAVPRVCLRGLKNLQKYSRNFPTVGILRHAAGRTDRLPGWNTFPSYTIAISVATSVTVTVTPGYWDREEQIASSPP